MSAQAGEEAGADVLPFGLMTDVSAGALAAGSGVAQGGGQASGILGAQAGFAKELNAFTGDGKAAAEGDAATEVSVEGVGPQADLPLNESGEEVVADVPGELLPDQVPLALVPQPELPVPAAAGEGLIGIKGAEAPLPGSPIPAGGKFAEGSSPSGESGMGQAASAALAASGGQLPLGGASGQSGQAPSTVPNPPGVSPLSEGHAEGAVAKPPAAGAMARVGSSAVRNEGFASPELVAGDASGVEKSAANEPELVAAKKAASRPVVANAVAGERKWQSELPQELRAPSMRPEQRQFSMRLGLDTVASSEDQVLTGTAKGVTLAADAKAAIQPASPDAPKTAAGPEGIVPALKQALAGAQDGKVTDTVAATEPVNAKASSDAKAQVAEPSATLKGAQPAAAVASQATVTPAAPPAVAVRPEQVALAEGDVADSVGGEELPDFKPVTDAKSEHLAGSRPDRLSDAATARAPEAPLGDKALASNAPVAGVAGVSQLADSQVDPVSSTTDWTFTGEAGATVRGGDLTGAMRTESLQTPNQAQSGQVATQVAAEIARNLKNGQTRFQMRFDPPELGRVEVNMKVGADGNVQAHLIVERPETLDMFMRDQRGLERALEAAGLNADSENLQFSLKQDGGREFASGNGQHDQSAEGAQDLSGSEASGADSDNEDIVRLTLAEQRGGLDVKI